MISDSVFTAFVSCLTCLVAYHILRLGGTGYGTWIGACVSALMTACATHLGLMANPVNVTDMMPSNLLLLLLIMGFSIAVMASARYAYATTPRLRTIRAARRRGALIGTALLGTCLVLFVVGWLMFRL